MNSPATADPRLIYLINAAVDEALSADERNELARLLRENPPARRLYCRWMGLHVVLDSALTKPLDVAALVAGWPIQPVVLSAQPQRGRARRRLISPLAWSIAGCAAMYLVYIVAISWDLLRFRQRDAVAVGSVDVETPLAGINNRTSATGSVATIGDSVGVQWSPGPGSAVASARRPTDVASGEPLQIESGLVELRLKQGVRLLVEGPATWSIDGINGATLRRGKLVAHVPPSATGFVLDTPHVRIVDVGTEFGVDVSSSTLTAVQVLQGEVTYAPREPKTGEPGAAHTLRVGEAVQFAAATDASVVEVLPAAFTPQRFVRSATKPTSADRPLVQLKWPKGHTARQSSHLDANRFEAAKALDGDLTSFTHTNGQESVAWWQVELPQSEDMAAVVILNRIDCCRGRLRDIVLKVLDEHGREVFASPPLNPENSQGEGIENFNHGPTQIVVDLARRAGKPVVGQVLRIERHIPERQLPGHDAALTLAEVQVFQAVPVVDNLEADADPSKSPRAATNTSNR